MQGSAGGELTGDVDEAWGRFRQQRAAELEAWLRAERDLAGARLLGSEDEAAGERLVVAEASLQTAIVDFAASVPGVVNPTPMAIAILRRAEALLDSDRSGRGADVRERGTPPAEAPGDPGA